MNVVSRITRGFELKDLTSKGVFSGYGSVYDVVDQGDDIVAQGAFADSLASWGAKGKLPKLLWQHNSREPIGTYKTMREDSHGLYVEGQFTLDVQRAKEAYALVREKALDGLSIGFMTRDDSYDQKTGVRTIKKADLMEVSIVTFAMNEAASIDEVKALPDFSAVSDLERFLRDVGNFSRTEAKTLTSRVVAMVQRDVGTGEDSSQAILKALRASARAFTPA